MLAQIQQEDSDKNSFWTAVLVIVSYCVKFWVLENSWQSGLFWYELLMKVKYHLSSHETVDEIMLTNTHDAQLLINHNLEIMDSNYGEGDRRYWYYWQKCNARLDGLCRHYSNSAVRGHQTFCWTYELPPLHLVVTSLNFVNFYLHELETSCRGCWLCHVTLKIKCPQFLVLKNSVPKCVSPIFRKC